MYNVVVYINYVVYMYICMYLMMSVNMVVCERIEFKEIGKGKGFKNIC